MLVFAGLGALGRTAQSSVMTCSISLRGLSITWEQAWGDVRSSFCSFPPCSPRLLPPPSTQVSVFLNLLHFWEVSRALKQPWKEPKRSEGGQEPLPLWNVLQDPGTR